MSTERDTAKSDPTTTKKSSPRNNDEDEEGEQQAKLKRTMSRSDDISSMVASKIDTPRSPNDSLSKNRKELLCSLKTLDKMDFKKFVQEQKEEQKQHQEKFGTVKATRQHRSAESLRDDFIVRSSSDDGCDRDDDDDDEDDDDDDDDEDEDGEDGEKGEEKSRSPNANGNRKVKIKDNGKRKGGSGVGTKEAGGSLRVSLRKVKSDGESVCEKGVSLKKLQYHSMGEFVELKVAEKMKRTKAYEALTQLLLDNESLALAVCLSIARTENDSTYAKIIRFFLHHKKDMQLIRLLMKKEINDTAEAATLFRSNDVVTKLLSAHARVIGRLFLVDILRPPIEELLLNMDDGISYEIDPIKLGPEKEHKIAENAKNIEKAVESVIENVETYLPSLPMPIKNICVELDSQVARKFQTDTLPVVGGYFFLRFLCPAMFSPENYGIIFTSASTVSPYLYSVSQGRIQKSVIGEISNEKRRALILVSKALQQLANNIPFGAKEEYMTILNPFLDKHFERVKNIFRTILAPEQTHEDREKEFKFDALDMEQTQHVFHKILYDNMAEVEANFSVVLRFMDAPTPRRILADEQQREIEELKKEAEEKKQETQEQKGKKGKKGKENKQNSDEEKEKERENEQEKESKQEKEVKPEKELEVIQAIKAIPRIELLSLSGNAMSFPNEKSPLASLRDLVKFLGEPPSKSRTAEIDLERAKAEELKARNEQMQKIFEQRYRGGSLIQPSPRGMPSDDSSPGRRPTATRRLNRSNTSDGKSGGAKISAQPSKKNETPKKEKGDGVKNLFK